MTDFTFTLRDQVLHLLPERAVYWPRESTLLIADPHWGKDTMFRAAGVALPGGVLTDDLARLSAALRRSGAQRLVVLGDLLHAKRGRAESLIAEVSQWRAEFATLDVVIVRGNHDHSAGDPPVEWRFVCVSEPMLAPPFSLQHFPTESDAYTLSGHLHPGARLRGKGGQGVTLPCFWFGKQIGILPAFGGFTGLAAITPTQGDYVFVIVEDEILQVAGA